MLIPVILSGGIGSRLWPVSRAAHPKPFMTLPDGENLITKTFKRGIAINSEVIYTITNRELFFKTQDEFEKIENTDIIKHHYILEPFGRNTAAAVLCAALQIEEQISPNARMLVLASDHLIVEEERFLEAVQQANTIAEDHQLVTFGIEAKTPETGYGYIEINKEQAIHNGYAIKNFVEKPSKEVAGKYIQSGNFYWNSGMFCFKAETIIKAFKEYEPNIYKAVLETIASSKYSKSKNVSSLELSAEKFKKVKDDSIDYAIMEKAKNIAAIVCDIGWNDIGSWSAMSELTPSNEHGNRSTGGEVIYEDSTSNYVHSNDRLTALLGVKDLIVIDTPDALLIANKNQAQDVKKIVSQLKSSKHSTHEHHVTVNRPWGTYTTIEEGERFKIKRITVKPKASLSLQMHHHRSEHWIVVSGTAKVINDDEEFILSTNESTYIKAGHTHRLENPGVIDLILIEVQSGDYLGEDDIIRIEDIYGRTNK